MPLIEQSLPARETSCDSRQPERTRKLAEDLHERSRDSYASQHTTFDEDLLDLFVDMDDEQYMIEEATVMDAREVKTKEVTIEPPALPARNSLRASKLLDSLKLNTIESATQSLNTTHELYLSSEEDASSSADDFSDYDSDSTSDKSERSPSRRGSQEDTARAVSVVYVGKPCLVDLVGGRRPHTPLRRPQSCVFERSSTSSSGTDSFKSRPGHPPRQSSLALVASSTDMPKESPSFLSQDPFANNYKLDAATKASTASPRASRAPTAAFHRFQRSISLARKRSRANLKDAGSRDSFIASNDLPALNTSHIPRESTPEPMSATTPQSPVTYNEIMRTAKKNSTPVTSPLQHPSSPPPASQPMSPMSPMASKKGRFSGLNLNRRRSISIRIKP